MRSLEDTYKLSHARAVALVSAIHEGFQRNIDVFQQVTRVK